MKSTCLVILASLTICNLAVCGGQSISTEDDTDRMSLDDVALQRAEGLLLRSILQKLQDDERNEGITSQNEWVTKRQHPGKRYGEDLEKRQHPGRREENEDEPFLDMQKRQHPGKREDEIHSLLGLHKRQHPGKRFTMEHISDNPDVLFGEFSKRQHPGKRYLMLHTKRQHPGKRHPEFEDSDWDWEVDGDGDEDLQDVEKRQHPGKRFWDNSSPDIDTNSPCGVLDPASCSKTSLLLDFLENVNKSHAEEKRQHPGKRLAQEEDLVEAE